MTRRHTPAAGNIGKHSFSQHTLSMLTKYIYIVTVAIVTLNYYVKCKFMKIQCFVPKFEWILYVRVRGMRQNSKKQVSKIRMFFNINSTSKITSFWQLFFHFKSGDKYFYIFSLWHPTECISTQRPSKSINDYTTYFNPNFTQKHLSYLHNANSFLNIMD